MLNLQCFIRSIMSARTRKKLFKWLKRIQFLFPDKTYLRLAFYLQAGFYPDLDNPRSLGEKIQWLKLHDHNPEYRRMTDKVTAKEYAAERIGKQHIIPTLGVWDNPDDIDWDSLPDKFVIKLTYGSGGRSVWVCKDKSKFDRAETVKGLKHQRGRDLSKFLREWAYGGIRKRVIAEAYLETSDPAGVPPDYKFWCFNGKAKFLDICRGKANSDSRVFNYLDLDWNPTPFWRIRPNTDEFKPKPDNFDEMVQIAEKLAEGIPFVRVDLYNENGVVYFGEMTLYPGSGMKIFEPIEWEYKLGDLLQLPQ